MNYKKKYEEALEKAKKVYNDHRKDRYWRDWLTELFPELKESEDERIKKTLIEYIKGIKSWNYFLGISKEQMITWLEKQGEKKPADKVEPKFKVGDWITNGNDTWEIVGVKPLDYILQSQDGNIVDDTISYIDKQFILFTIKD